MSGYISKKPAWYANLLARPEADDSIAIACTAVPFIQAVEQDSPYSYRFDELAQHYRNHRRLAEHWHRLAPGRILDVHYEDLVREPEAQVLRVLEYCGLKQLPGLTDIRANTTISTTMSTQQVRQPIHQRNIGGWQRYRSHLEPLAVLLEDLIDTERPEHR